MTTFPTANPTAESGPTNPADPRPRGLFAPIHLTKPETFVPHAYVIQVAEFKCVNCGTLHRTSQVFAENRLKPRSGEGKYITHLVPVDRAAFNVPVRRIPMATKSTPFCHECEGIDLSHLPPPPKQEALTPPELLNRHARPVSPKGQAPTKKKPTLDDLA